MTITPNFLKKIIQDFLYRVSEGITPDTPSLPDTPLIFLRREAAENFLVRKSLIKKFCSRYPPFFSRKNRTRGGIWSDTP